MAVSSNGSLLEDDAKVSAVWQNDAFAQPARATKAVQQAGDRPRVLTKFGGLPLQTVDFLNDLNGQEDVVVLELEQRIGVMEQYVGIKDVVLLHDQKS